MRKILFRGQIRKKGEKVYMGGTSVPCKWVYGGICQGKQRSIIYGGEFEDVADKHVVYSETVGQYTGLTDKNGTKIFEGDLVKITELGMVRVGVVEFINAYVGGWVIGDPEGNTTEKCSLSMRKNVEVIGNIHESEVENG